MRLHTNRSVVRTFIATLMVCLCSGAHGLQVSIYTLSSQCFQPDGSASAVITNGTAPYSFAWSTGASGISYQAFISLEGLVAGNYAIEVTDATGAIAFTSGTVGERGITSAGIILDRFDCFASCNGVGRILPTEFGGTPPYQFSHPTSPDPLYTEMLRIDGLCHPYDTVRITDALGCTGEVPLFVGYIAPIPIPASEVQPACGSDEDGTLTLTWGNLQVTSFRIEGPTLDSVVTGASSPYTFEGLGAGTWTVQPWEPYDGWFCFDPIGCPRYCWPPTIVEVPEAPLPCGLTTALAEAPAAVQLRLDPSGDHLIASGFDGPGNVRLFTADGRGINAPIQWHNGSLQLELRQLLPGVYILHTPRGSARFVKQ